MPDGGMPGTPPGASGLRPRPGPGQEPEAIRAPLARPAPAECRRCSTSLDCWARPRHRSGRPPAWRVGCSRRCVRSALLQKSLARLRGGWHGGHQAGRRRRPRRSREGFPNQFRKPPPAQHGVQTVRLVSADGRTASGSARVERAPSGLVVVLTVEGLAANPPGELCMCWLVDADDTLDHVNRFAVGTFSVSGPRPITMRWANGADTSQYRLDVTLEHTDGNPLAPALRC